MNIISTKIFNPIVNKEEEGEVNESDSPKCRNYKQTIQLLQ